MLGAEEIDGSVVKNTGFQRSWFQFLAAIWRLQTSVMRSESLFWCSFGEHTRGGVSHEHTWGGGTISREVGFTDGHSCIYKMNTKRGNQITYMSTHVYIKWINKSFVLHKGQKGTRERRSETAQWVKVFDTLKVFHTHRRGRGLSYTHIGWSLSCTHTGLLWTHMGRASHVHTQGLGLPRTHGGGGPF